LKESSARVGTAGDKDEEAAGARGVRVEVLQVEVGTVDADRTGTRLQC
jgi:hypothetical protein